MKNVKPHQKLMILAIVMSIALTFIPYVRVALIPLFYLDTHLHELGHALAGLATGNQVKEINIHWAGNGETLGIGGNHEVIVGSAGYIGAIIFGAIVILSSKTERGSQLVLRFLAVVIALSMAFFVRGDLAGLVTGAFWIFALFGLSMLKGNNAMFAAQFIGIQQCIHAFESVTYLLKVGTSIESDATIVADATHIPAMVWALSWTGLSLVVGFFTLRAVWSRTPKTPALP